MPPMGQSYDHWYVIVAYEYPCRSYIVLVSPCFSIHVFTYDASLLHSTIRIICSPWCIHFDIYMLRSIKNWFFGSFWIFMILRASNYWLYAPPALLLTVCKYAVMIPVVTFLFPQNSIHDQQRRFKNSWPIEIARHDTSSTFMMAVPPLWNVPSEVVTRLYPVLILLV